MGLGQVSTEFERRRNISFCPVSSSRIMVVYTAGAPRSRWIFLQHIFFFVFLFLFGQQQKTLASFSSPSILVLFFYFYPMLHGNNNKLITDDTITDFSNASFYLH
jgi:hypothetical protein